MLDVVGLLRNNADALKIGTSYKRPFLYPILNFLLKSTFESASGEIYYFT
jgi:hypothetical protein